MRSFSLNYTWADAQSAASTDAVTGAIWAEFVLLLHSPRGPGTSSSLALSGRGFSTAQARAPGGAQRPSARREAVPARPRYPPACERPGCGTRATQGGRGGSLRGSARLGSDSHPSCPRAGGAWPRGMGERRDGGRGEGRRAGGRRPLSPSPRRAPGLPRCGESPAGQDRAGGAEGAEGTG